MTDRKFTPPTEFPAEYATRDGKKAVIMGTMPNNIAPYIGYVISDIATREQCWSVDGAWNDIHTSDYDLFDIVPSPKKQVHWANNYYGISFGHWWSTREIADENEGNNRIAVIRREWIEGQLPQYFTEEV